MTYRDTSSIFRSSRPTMVLPGLVGVKDWFRVLPMVTARGAAEDAASRLQSGDLRPRMIVAARYPAEGFDTESLGPGSAQRVGYWLAVSTRDRPGDHRRQEAYRELDAHTPSKYTPRT